MKTTIHLVTQRDQPYGSVRRCCEICGLATSAMNGRVHAWTDDQKRYEAPRDDEQRCDTPPSETEE